VLRSVITVLIRLLACAWLFSSCVWNVARADAPAEPPFMSTRLNADPNGAAYGAEYRGAVRGRFSDSFEFYGGEAEAGYSIALAPLFELHEPRKSHNVLPSQYWRARISLAQSYGWIFENLRVRIFALLTHESDHETAHAYSRPGFLAINDLALRAQVSGRSSAWAWYASGDAQFYFLSCTQPSRRCENFHGDHSFGGQAQAGLAYTGRKLWTFSPFAAASASGIVAHGIVHKERRLLARLGAYTQLGDSLLSLFVLGSLGNDVGVVRNRTLNVVGGGIAFAR
jgi:hypothetical protein